MRRVCKPFIHRAAFVGLVMAKHDPAKFLRGHEPCNGAADKRKHPPQASMEEERLVPQDQELVEGDAAWFDLRQEGGKPVHPIRDLVDLCFHGLFLLRAGSWI